MQALTRLIMLRVAAGDPEEEKKLEKSLATRVDWKVVRENDQKLGPKVRALFPFATAQPRGLPATSPSSARPPVRIAGGVSTSSPGTGSATYYQLWKPSQSKPIA